MTSRAVLALLPLLAFVARPSDVRAARVDAAAFPEGAREAGGPAIAGEAAGSTVHPASVSGVADLRLTTPDSRVSLRLIFAASGEPARLRIEVVRAGTLLAVAWHDAERVIVFAPTEGLVHEGPPTRQTLEDALGLPFCPADVIHALRGGLPPVPPPCDGSDATRLATGSGDAGAVELRRGGARPTRLRFSRYRDVAGRRWPHRVTLESDLAHAVVDMIAIGQGPLAPMPPSAEQLAAARRVDAATLSRALGIARNGAPAPAAHEELGR